MQIQRIPCHVVPLFLEKFPVKVISRQETFPNLPFSVMQIAVSWESVLAGLEIEVDSDF
jgi:hypothetical protein